jgi:hypothetical protein
MAAARKSDERLAPHLTEITVEGFKSLRDRTTIEVRPLTILAGANSAGKSSIMHPVLLLKQTLEAPYDPGPLRLDGPNVRFTQTEQLLWRKGRERTEFTVGLRFSTPPALELSFGVEVEGPLNTVSQLTKGGGFNLRLAPGESPSDLFDRVPAHLAKFLRESAEREKSPLAFRVARERCFLYLEDARKGREPMEVEGARRRFPAFFYPIPPWVDEAVLGLVHLPGLRGNPERSYRLAAAESRFPGLFQEYVASVLAKWKAADRNRLQELGATLEELGLTWTVDVKPIDETQVEIRVGRLVHPLKGGARDLVNIADVGSGVSQCLPVVVALIGAGAGQIVYLEQPEIHLHPRAQVALAGLLAKTAERGVRLIVETHSALVLKGIQTLMAKGAFSPELVKLHWFTRQADGATKVASADLDQDGAFGDWPEDFGEVEMKTESDYLDAVSLRQR